MTEKKKRDTEAEERTTNEKPVSLNPVEFEEALQALLVIPLSKEPKEQEQSEKKQSKDKRGK